MMLLHTRLIIGSPHNVMYSPSSYVWYIASYIGRYMHDCSSHGIHLKLVATNCSYVAIASLMFSNLACMQL